MRAGGFTEKEAHLIMPLIGYMDLTLAAITLVHPIPLLTAWMVAWAAATALARPISGGHICGFIERAGNFVCPLALLRLQVTGGGGGRGGGGGEAAWRLEHAAFGALERALDFGFGWDEYWKFAFGAVVVLWGVFTPILRMRSVHKSKEA